MARQLFTTENTEVTEGACVQASVSFVVNVVVGLAASLTSVADH